MFNLCCTAQVDVLCSKQDSTQSKLEEDLRVNRNQQGETECSSSHFQVTPDISFLVTGKKKCSPHIVQNKELPGHDSHGLSKTLKTQLNKTVFSWSRWWLKFKYSRDCPNTEGCLKTGRGGSLQLQSGLLQHPIKRQGLGLQLACFTAAQDPCAARPPFSSQQKHPTPKIIMNSSHRSSQQQVPPPIQGRKVYLCLDGKSF